MKVQQLCLELALHLLELPFEPLFQHVPQVDVEHRRVHLQVLHAHSESAPELHYQQDFVVEEVVVELRPVEQHSDGLVYLHEILLGLSAENPSVLLIALHSHLHCSFAQLELLPYFTHCVQVLFEERVRFIFSSNLERFHVVFCRELEIRQ